MAIQYAGGTNVNTTYTADGTAQSLASAIEDAMNTAGWVTDSGHHSGTIVLHSATTPGGHRISLRIKTGGDVTLELCNAALNVVGQMNYLDFTAGRVWRFLMNKYQCFIFVDGTNAQQGKIYAGWGTLCIPAYMNVPAGEVGWLNSDYNGGPYGILSFRNGLSTNQTMMVTTIWLGTVYNSSANNSGNTHGHSLLRMCRYNCTDEGYREVFYPDGSSFVWDAIFISQTQSESDRVRGWLWDAVCINLPIAAGDSIVTVDGKRFQVVGYGSPALAVYAPV